VQGGREGGIGQEVQNLDKQQHQAQRAYRAAFLQFKMVSDSKRARSYSGGAVSLPCKPGRRTRGGIGQEVQNQVVSRWSPQHQRLATKTENVSRLGRRYSKAGQAKIGCLITQPQIRFQEKGTRIIRINNAITRLLLLVESTK
jgi:hypothetical protein